ncbi:ABC-type transport auxiliary lipoprotein family protein [Marinobacter sp.]|uniref:ABC-type transport auxiliary lipoprotein family protein n=1 Tax=Marinobacter sp. TaxID=50741 RepID=UPI0034A5D5F2
MTVRTHTMAALALIIAMMTGCTVFPDREPPRVMDIPLLDTTGTTDQRIDKTLRVDTPYAADPFDSSGILTKPSPTEYQVYGGVRWRDTAPVLIREVMIGALRQDGRFAGVVNETSPSTSDLTLTSDLYGFHSETDADGDRVVINLYGQLLDNQTRKTLCTGNFQATSPAADGEISAVVTAFGDASADLLQQMQHWLADCLD